MNIKKQTGNFKNGKSSKYPWVVKFRVGGKLHKVGTYETKKQAERSHDVYVLKHNLDVETISLKKKLV